MKNYYKTLLLSTCAGLIVLASAIPSAHAEIQMLPPKSVAGAECSGSTAANPTAPSILAYSGISSAGINCIDSLTVSASGVLSKLASSTSLDVAGAATLAGALTVSGATALNGGASVTGELAANSRLSVTNKDNFILGGEQVGSTIFSLKNVAVCGDGEALKKTGGDSFDCVKITNLKYGSNVVQTDVPVCTGNGVLTFNGSNFTCKDVLTSGGDIVVPGTTTTKTLHVTENATVDGDITAGGTITGDNFVATDASKTSTFAGNVTVEKGLGVGGNLDVAGVARVLGGVTTDALAANSLSVTNNATIGGNLAVTGDITARDITARNGTFSGDLSARNGTFSGDVAVAGNLDVGSLTINGQPFTGSGSSGPSICPALATTVPADTMWVDTAIDVHANSVLMIKATGTWYNGAARSTADGYGTIAQNGNPLLYGRMGTLIGRIGASGQPFEVGSHYSQVNSEAGRLYLTANDDAGWFGDNTGTMSVSVSGLAESANCPSTPSEPDMCSQGQVTVNYSGTNSGIIVRSGQRISISGSMEPGELVSVAHWCDSWNSKGWVTDCHARGWTGPQGYTGQTGSMLSSAPLASLLVRIGSSGTWHNVGTNTTFVAERAGELQFAANNAGNMWDRTGIAYATVAISGNQASGNCTVSTPVNGVCNATTEGCISGTYAGRRSTANNHWTGQFSCYGAYGGTSQTDCVASSTQPVCDSTPWGSGCSTGVLTSGSAPTGTCGQYSWTCTAGTNSRTCTYDGGECPPPDLP